MRSTTFDCPTGARLTATDLGFGGAPLGNLITEVAEADAAAALQTAWDSGCRWYDTAPFYGMGLSEERFGRLLRDKPRGDYVLSTKIGRIIAPADADEADTDKFVVPQNKQVVWDYGYDGVMRSFEDSLNRLSLDSIDVLFCHDLDIWTHGNAEATEARRREFMEGGYRAMTELREQGAVTAIGAGLNEWEACQILAEQGDFDLFLLAGRYTLLEQTALESFLPLCEARGIGILLGGPYNSGILATGPVEGAYYDYQPAPPDVLARVARIEAVCKAHGAPLPAAALQFPLAHPQVISIIPGGRTAAEVAQNVEMLNVAIPDALWSDLCADGLLRTDAPTPGGS